MDFLTDFTHIDVLNLPEWNNNLTPPNSFVVFFQLPPKECLTLKEYNQIVSNYGVICLVNVLSQLVKKTVKAEDILIDKNGKPYWNEPFWHFNISHSKSNIIIAFSHNEQVGCDIELKNNRPNWKQLAVRFTTPNEQKVINIFGERGFLIVWTRKEAILKMTGLGIRTKLNQLETLIFDANKFNKLLFSFETDTTIGAICTRVRPIYFRGANMGL